MTLRVMLNERETGVWCILILLAFIKMLFLLISADNESGTPFPAYYSQVRWTDNLQTAQVTLFSLVATLCLLCAHMIGCGYPPLSVRAVAKRLSETLQIPALGLFDYNVS